MIVRIPILDSNVLAVDEAHLLQTLAEAGNEAGGYRAGSASQEANDRHLRLLLPQRPTRPHDRCATQPGDEIAARGHSITSSARPSMVAGILMPSALAVFTLITISNLLAACTGSSPG